jgi:hypothetical protein
MMPIGMDGMDDEKNFDNKKFDYQPNYITSTVVDENGKIIDYKDDGDNNIYLNERGGIVVGTERKGVTYTPGNSIVQEDLNEGFIIQDGTIWMQTTNDPNMIKGGAGMLEYIGGGGIIKVGSLLKRLQAFFKLGKKLNPKMLKAFQTQLKQHGRKSVLKSQKKITRRLVEHQKKLKEIKKAGGHTSSVEREIKTFKAQLQAIKKVLK